MKNLNSEKTDCTKNYNLQTASGRGADYVQEITGIWKFDGRALTAKEALCAEHSEWENVTVPHTWNAIDAEDGGNDYDRTAYWYHKNFSIDSELNGKRVYIEFLGANTKTDLYINGEQVGDTHKGGYTAFRYDVTDVVREGDNVMDVRVDNCLDQEIAPISADFNMYGGIYRRVYLVIVDEVHIDLDNNGSSGIFLTTGNMRSKSRPEDIGSFQVKTDIINASAKEKDIEVVVTVYGDNAPEPFVDKMRISANSRVTYKKHIAIDNPTLWEGVNYEKNSDDKNVGYQYTVTVELKADGNTVCEDMGNADRINNRILDKVEERIGFRYFWIDEEGFFLNGKSHPLRGVNRHSFLAGVGSAMTEEQHDNDMDIMLDLGVNAVRLCHYPQTDYFYDLCDKNGIVVWSEIPLVNMIGSADKFEEVTKKQLTELIYQQYNRPSVVMWGLENEIGNGTDMSNARAHEQVSKAKKLMYNLEALARELDTTGRYTTQAVNRDYAMNQNVPESVNRAFEDNVGWKSDIVAWNIYPKWYPDANFYGSFEEVMTRKQALDSRPMAISEYGWGANVSHHEAYPCLGENNLTAGGSWHPEEYQSIMSEEAIAYIKKHNELWATFCWVLFDFAVDARNEGGQIALNDKGLVTGDRKIKKDSFYLYKANWNKRDAFAYITSRRWTERTEADTYIKVYSNCDKVELFIGNESLGYMESKPNGVFIMENVTLPMGEVSIKVIGTCEGDEAQYKDICVWKCRN